EHCPVVVCNFLAEARKFLAGPLVVVGERERGQFLHVRGADSPVVGEAPHGDVEEACPWGAGGGGWGVEELGLDRADARQCSVLLSWSVGALVGAGGAAEIGRASCRER